MHRRSAVVVGALFIVATVSSIAGLLLYGPVLNEPGYVLNGAPHSTQIAAGAFLEMVLAFSVIGLSIAAYPVMRKVSESLALGYVCFRLLEVAVIVVGAISLLSVVTLGRQEHPDPASMLTAGELLVAVHDWTFLFGPNFLLAPSTLILGFVLYRSRLVPRFIAVWGLVGGSLIFVSATLVLFGVYPQISTWGTVAALPVFAFEMVLAVRLIVKGFN